MFASFNRDLFAVNIKNSGLEDQLLQKSASPAQKSLVWDQWTGG